MQLRPRPGCVTMTKNGTLMADTSSKIRPACYWIGATVYHRLVDEKRAGLITGVTFTPEGHYYWVTWPDLSEAKHYEMELTSEYVPDYEN